tara:strand:- start:3509 stop:3889 length:381 start_codon:yes stop_codon:yes gene_type:complete
MPSQFSSLSHCHPKNNVARATLPEAAVKTGTVVATQFCLVAISAGWLFAMPPAEGFMMLVPLGSSATRTLPALAVRKGARLVATGPIPGSLIVYGHRGNLMRPLLLDGIITVATMQGGCSSGETDD